MNDLNLQNSSKNCKTNIQSCQPEVLLSKGYYELKCFSASLKSVVESYSVYVNAELDELCQAQPCRSNEKDYMKWLTNFSRYVELLRDLHVGSLDMNRRLCHDVGFLLNNINVYYSKRNVNTFEPLFKEFCGSMQVVETILTELACKFWKLKYLFDSTAAV